MTYTEVLEQARKVLAPKCRVCPECNGLACRGKIPGPGGAGNGQGFTECRAFFKRIKLRMDAIHPAEEIDTSVELFGKTFSAPFFVAPIGGMSFNYTGHFTEAQFSEYIVQGALNCGTMAFTADGPDDAQFPAILPIIEKANGMAVSTVKPWEREKLMKRLRDLESVGAIAVATDIDSAALINLKLLGKPVSTKSVDEWKDIISSTKLPLIFKGVITPESALKCVEAGAYGIIVSTHGGRVMEDFPVPASMLSEIRAAVGDKLKIFVDGGIRSGGDVFKCLALGADAVLIGRPYVIAAHGGGQEGVELYTRKIMAELTEAMMMTDCRTLADIDSSKIELHKSYRPRQTEKPLDLSSPSIVRDPNKCIQCGECQRVCEQTQKVGAVDLTYTIPAAESGCVGCGQCRVVCPTGAVSIHTNMSKVKDALADPDTLVVAQIAPSVRVSVSEAFGLPAGTNVMGKLVSALHAMGFDQVYDTALSADLTVIEEADEFLQRLASGGTLPLFTSCCPAWVKFCETRYPEFAANLSTCRSPQQMFGAVIQEYYRDGAHLNGKRLVSVSIMPCTAKKEEILRPESHTFGKQDIDFELTSAELIAMLEGQKISLEELVPQNADIPFDLSSGGGVIFGVSGGVTEAVLRYVHKAGGDSVNALQDCGVRGDAGIREFQFTFQGRDIKAAVVSGLGNADALLQKLRAGEVSYDFVEVMACPQGCVMGGGQPVDPECAAGAVRTQGLYATDQEMSLRSSHDNPTVAKLYDTLMKDKTHALLHRNFGGESSI